MPLYLPYDPPFAWPSMLEHLSHRLTAGVDTIARGRYSRTAAIDGDVGALQVYDDAENGRLVVTMTDDLRRHRERIGRRLRRMFDLDVDYGKVQAVLHRDPLLRRIEADYPGIRVPGAWLPFELLVRTIVGQQVSVAAATTVMGRIIGRTAEVDDTLSQLVAKQFGDEGPTLLFPSAEAIAEADLTDIGMPTRRVATLQSVSRLITDGGIPFPGEDDVLDEVDKETVKEALLDQFGIGPWTVEYFALRALGDSDAWPGSDLILRRAMQTHPDCENRSPQEIADGWRPYRAYAAIYLWYGASLGD